MSLIVEDGTGKADAESFISVADATTYHANLGNAAWAALASDTVREQLLRKATAYMEQYYRLKWAGYRKTTTQALSWPRYDVPLPDSVNGGYRGYPIYVLDTIVPAEVKNACAELALKASSDELAPDLTQGVLREKIGPLEVEYDKNSTQYTRYRAIDNMLAPFLDYLAGGLNHKVVRV